MEQIFLAVAIVLTGLNLLVVIMILNRTTGISGRILTEKFNNLEKNQERLERTLKEEITHNRNESAVQARNLRDELNQNLQAFTNAVLNRLSESSTAQKNQLESFSEQLNRFTQISIQKMDKINEIVEKQLGQLRDDNNKKLEQMRLTVDEKLHATLERRLGESFKLVSDRLEQVQQGLGEMKNLAVGVGDLKRVLTNVKTRGIWGEVQLGALLEQILTGEQYERNVVTKPGASERVEYAVKLPGREDNDKPVWLPIDAKFPQEDYQRLLEAQEQANVVLVEEAGRALEARIKSEAKAIAEKYISPPDTTEFGVMFLPIEGLFAEVLRRPGLYDILLNEYRVVICGPTTLAAFLNSLQMGFRTLAVEKRSSEVWKLLGAVKTEFGKFGDLLDQTGKKLDAASKAIDLAARKTRTIERKLRTVQELPQEEAEVLLDEASKENNSTEDE